MSVSSCSLDVPFVPSHEACSLISSTLEHKIRLVRRCSRSVFCPNGVISVLKTCKACIVSCFSSNSKNFCCRIKNWTFGMHVCGLIKGTCDKILSALCHCPSRILDLNSTISLDSRLQPDSASKASAAFLRWRKHISICRLLSQQQSCLLITEVLK